MRTTDNNNGECYVSDKDLDNIRRIAGRRIADLVSDKQNAIWLFPGERDRYGDKIEDEVIFDLADNRLRTGNIMGFIGCGDTEVTICSRFSSAEKPDYFMQYLLQKVFAINVFNLNHRQSKDGAIDLTVLLFPYFLQKALLQGLYREYCRIEHNDDRVRGTIDFNRHIRMNYPFQSGNVAYTTREYRYDNSVTQLIRHTIEHIKSLRDYSFILYANTEIKSFVQTIIDATPSFREGDLTKVMDQNIRPKIHPYYSEYLPLQRLCIEILRHKKKSYGQDSEKIHGVLFDGAWLWEEYLSITMTKAGFIHPQNKTGKGGIQVYSNRRGILRFPDFIHTQIIADAKYKRLYKKDDSSKMVGIPRDDLNQMISYLHITQCGDGVFICPNDDFGAAAGNGEHDSDYAWNLMHHRVGILRGFGGQIHIISLNIPQDCPDYQTFNTRMEGIEASLKHKLDVLIAGDDESAEYTYA